MKKKKEISCAELENSFAPSFLFVMTFMLHCFLFFHCFDGYAQVKKGFTIEGNIKGLKAGSRLFLIIKKENKIDTVSRSMAKADSFVFRDVKLPYHPDFYLISIQTEFVDNLQLFLNQAADVKINGNFKTWPNVMVTGSKTHDDYLAYIKLRDIGWKEYDSLMNVGASKDKMKENNGRARLVFMKQHPDSFFIPYALITWKDEYGQVISPEVKKTYFDLLPAEVKNSYYGKQLDKQMIEYAESKQWVGQLERSIVDLKSISREEALTQLTITANKQFVITPLPISGKQLTKAELAAKSKAATMILNMGYRNPGDSITRANPTTAYVIDESGICVTNYHVGKEYSSKAPYQSLSVMTAEGKSYPVVRILSCSESDDLMVFQVDTKGEKLSALPLGNAAANGANINVMAHPLGNFYRFTSGKVSDYSRSTLAGRSCNIMSITADFNIGSSGGPIVDSYGNVVGTVSRIDGGMKVGIPVDELKKLIEFKK